MSQKRIVDLLLKVDPNVEVGEDNAGVFVRLYLVTPLTLRTVAGVPGITSLELLGNFDAEDDSFACLRQLTNLKELRIHCRSSGRCLHALPQITSLRSLSLSVPSETPLSLFEAMKGCLHLEDVDIAGDTNMSIDSECIECVAGMTGIKKLILCNRMVSADFGVLQHLASLKEINLTSARVTSESLNSISKCRSLQTIDVSFTSCGDETIEHFLACTELKLLACRRTQVTESAMNLFARFLKLEESWMDVSVVAQSNVVLFERCLSLKRLMLFGDDMDRKLERKLRATLSGCEIVMFLRNRRGC